VTSRAPVWWDRRRLAEVSGEAGRPDRILE